MKERNIVVSIILTIVTCGIYGIYWFVSLTDEVTAESGESFTSGVLAFILTIITCNIYGIYWAYKMGKLLQQAQIRKGNPSAADNSVLYCLLAVFGFQIVNWALIQNEMNQMSGTGMN